jgi:hypothetical protein
LPDDGMPWPRSADPAYLRKVRTSLQEAIARTRRLQEETQAVLARASAMSQRLERSRTGSMEPLDVDVDVDPVDDGQPPEEWPPTAPLIWPR